MRRTSLSTLALCMCLCVLLTGCASFRVNSLPYSDTFANNAATEWTALGGQWQIQSGAVVNRSDEDGAKLVTGSKEWRDYQLDADLTLIGQNGNMGVIVRVNREALGADSYSGYYVGLRSGDSAFVVGRADYGWLGGRPTSLQGGVHSGIWYHLRVVVVGCRLAAEATNLSTGVTTRLSFAEERCEPAGRIGLRSIGVGGAWRNVHVLPADSRQLEEIASHAAFTSHPEFPLREDIYNNMLAAFFHSTGGDAEAEVPRSPMAVNDDNMVSILPGKVAAAPGERLAFRGVVTMTSPLYIQDSTGGIEVRSSRASALNLGDELQVEGVLAPGKSSQFLQADAVHVLGERASVAAVAISGTRAADGSYDGRLVQLSGTLRAKSSAGDQVTLKMDDGEQTFQVEGRGLLSSRQLQSWEIGSTLRIRGICVMGPGANSSEGAFSILLSSMDDVQVVAGPPWWSPHLIARYILAALAFIGLCVYVYIRAERSKMRAIIDERERLAHEMHDTLAQSFAGVGFQLQGVRNSLRSGSLTLPVVLEKLDVACHMVTHTHREASAEIAALHPDADRNGDLLTTLERTTLAMAEDESPGIRLVREGNPRGISLATRDALFQVGREAITNVLRHSQAATIVMRLHYEPRQMTLEIFDDGCGFDYESHMEDFGLRAMRKRMQRVGGSLDVTTSPGQGTRVCAHAPYGARFGWAYLGGRLTARIRVRR